MLTDIQPPEVLLAAGSLSCQGQHYKGDRQDRGFKGDPDNSACARSLLKALHILHQLHPSQRSCFSGLDYNTVCTRAALSA